MEDDSFSKESFSGFVIQKEEFQHCINIEAYVSNVGDACDSCLDVSYSFNAKDDLNCQHDE